MSSDLTPMMRQYLDIKQKYSEAIIFFRLGDFYEMFFDDAVEAARILHITLTKREAGKGNTVPMCGVPHHAANNYIGRLIRHGKKVAICEQTEKPESVKKLLDRKVTRVITPGTFIADENLNPAANNFILSVNGESGNYGLAYADISTGEFRVAELNNLENLFAELYKISPRECLMPKGFSAQESFSSPGAVNSMTITIMDEWMFDYELALKEVQNHFLVKSLDGFGCGEMPFAIKSAGALLKYLKDTQKIPFNNFDVISTYIPSQYLLMDKNTHRHLELTENQEDLTSENTLLETLDLAQTPMGKRKLKRWILNPLLDTEKIRRRQDAVGYFHDNTFLRNSVRGLLREIYDIERLSNKMSVGAANARDMAALAFSLKQVGKLKNIFSGNLPEPVQEIIKSIDDFKDGVEWIENAIVENPPIVLKEGGLIKKGYDAALDEIRDIVAGGKEWMTRLQKTEIERTGINSLKLGYNRAFGYYIEITNANLKSVPSDYIRKQTLVGAERFITEELRQQESRIIGAEERLKEMEYQIFCRLRDRIAGEIERLKKTSEAIARLDVVSNLAEVAVSNHYSRPIVNDDGKICIKEGRHPVLEKMQKDKEFVPNDLFMDNEESRIFIITGSNMAGKSTFIRQIALITIMAQMGSFVPAAKAELSIVDRLFTRVGASDRLYRGMSTFMTEMVETANILNNATKKSLIILDEIGRGTSTFDGVSIAWAVVEFIHHNLSGVKAMFATHYHELTELAPLMKGVKNYHLAVREWKDEVIFLYRVEEGCCDESFGIHVARLAGMPKKVVTRAHEILSNLQKDSFKGNIRSHFLRKKEKADDKQPDFFN